MGIFSKKAARPSDTELWASAVMTYGQSLRAIGQIGVVDQNTLAVLFASLVNVVRNQSNQMNESDHVAGMLQVNFPLERSLSAPLLDLPLWSIPMEAYPSMRMASQSLAQIFFDQELSQEGAVVQGEMAARMLGAQSAALPSPFALGIGAAMTTIRSDTSGPRLVERGGMLHYGGQVGAEWVVRAINSPRFLG